MKGTTDPNDPDYTYEDDPNAGKVRLFPSPLEVWVCLKDNLVVRADEPDANLDYVSDKDLRITQSLLVYATGAIDEEIRNRKANSDA